MKRIVPLLLSAAMLVSLATSCTNTAENTPSPSQTATPSPTASGTVEDGYIPAPYTADASQTPTEYVAPVFYQNEDGPTISVTYNGVIVEDGKYFRDSDNDQELDPFEDWRLSTDERVEDLVSKMTQEQRIGLLMNSLVCNPEALSADEGPMPKTVRSCWISFSCCLARRMRMPPPILLRLCLTCIPVPALSVRIPTLRPAPSSTMR